MAINFTQAPDSNPFEVKPGFYKFKIQKAEMKTPKDTNKKDYLAMRLALSDINGKKKGMMFENIYDSDAPALMFKAKRLILAIGLDLTGSVELKDLAKLLPGKEGVLEAEVAKDMNNRDQIRVKTFGSECYWPLSDAKELMGEAAQDSDTDGDEPFVFDEESPEDDTTETTDEY